MIRDKSKEAAAIRELAENFFKSRDLEGVINFIFPESKEAIGFPNNEKDREVFISFLKKYCIDHKISRFYFLSEAYIAEASEGLMPSENPNREERFIITCIEKDKPTIIQMAAILNAGSSRFLGEWKEESVGAYSIWEQCL